MIGGQEVLYEPFPLTEFLADLLRLSNLDPKFILWTLFLGFHRRVGHRDSGFWPKPLNSVIYEIARAGHSSVPNSQLLLSLQGLLSFNTFIRCNGALSSYTSP